MSCRNAPRCRRPASEPSPSGLLWPHCATDTARLLTAAFGPEPEPRHRVRRLSESMPELQIVGRR